MRKLAIATAFVFALLFAQRANATYGYVCSINWGPSPNSLGSYGSALVSVYSGAQCSGSYVGNYYVCSTGYHGYELLGIRLGRAGLQ